MAWDKAYPEAGIPWDNDNSPYLNETNMGIIDEALKTHDERIIELYGTRQTVAGYADAAQTAEINALAYSNNAQAQAVNSQVSAAYSQAEADRAKAEADRAFSGTPEGYAALVDDVDRIEKNIGKTKNYIRHIMASTSENGVTCTSNGDGTYILNGTASADTRFYLFWNMPLSGTYRLTGCPSGGGDFNYNIACNCDDTWQPQDNGNGATIITNSVVTTILLFVKSGFTCNNLVFKPMLSKDMSATYEDFVPYVGSANTLVEDIASMPRLVSDEWSNKGYEKGRLVISNNTLYKCIMTHASGIAPTNATYWKATTVGAELMPTTDIYYGTAFKVLKNGNVCTWILTSVPTMNADGTTLSELIPSGYRPSASIMTVTKLFNGSSYVDARVRIYADGRVVLSDMWGVAISGLALQYAVTEEFTYVI